MALGRGQAAMTMMVNVTNKEIIAVSSSSLARQVTQLNDGHNLVAMTTVGEKENFSVSSSNLALVALL